MFAANFFQQVHHWFAPLSRWTHQASTPASPTIQLIVQPGDAYFLAAGVYRLRVLAGQLWLPEQGILMEGAQRELRVDWRGVELRPAGGGPVVVTVSAQLEG